MGGGKVYHLHAEHEIDERRKRAVDEKGKSKMGMCYTNTYLSFDVLERKQHYGRCLHQSVGIMKSRVVAHAALMRGKSWSILWKRRF